MCLLEVKTNLVAKKTFVIEAVERRKKIFVGEVSSYKIYSIDAEHFNCSMGENSMRFYEGMILFYHRRGEARIMPSKTSKMTGQELADVVGEAFGDSIPI